MRGGGGGLQRWGDVTTAEGDGGMGWCSPLPSRTQWQSTLIPGVGPGMPGEPRSSLSPSLGEPTNPPPAFPFSLDQAISFSHSTMTNTTVPMLTGQESQPQDRGRPAQSQVQILKEESGSPGSGPQLQINQHGGRWEADA